MRDAPLTPLPPLLRIRHPGDKSNVRKQLAAGE